MALTFNGTSQYVSVANNTAFNFTPNVTIMAWAKTTNTSLLTLRQRIVTRYLNGATANEQYGLDLSMGAPRFLLGSTTAVSTVTSGTTVTNGVWYHICGTYDGTTMRLYVNGVSVGTLARSGVITSSTGIFTIACDATSATARAEYFTGSIEEVRLYSRTLSASEVQTIYACKGTSVIRNSMVVNYNLDELRNGTSVAASATIYDTGPLKINGVNGVAGAIFSDGLLRKRRTL
jgi:hypothetical protein